MGYAIGDALGIGTAFMTRREVAHRYPGGLTEYAQIIRDAHRSQWPRGNYTAATRLVTLLAESIIECDRADNNDYAVRLVQWFKSDEGFDCDPHLIMTLSDKEFLSRPFEVANERHSDLSINEAHNEHLGRAMLIGMLPGDNEAAVIQNCIMTHPSSLCQVSAAIIAAMSNELLWYNRPASVDQLIGIARRIDDRAIPYLEVAHRGELAELELDDEDTLWYSRKGMAAALWALWHHSDPEEALHDIIVWGGDANINAALALGLIGLRYGIDSLPKHLVETLTDHENIALLAEKFAKTVLRKNRR